MIGVPRNTPCASSHGNVLRASGKEGGCGLFGPVAWKHGAPKSDSPLGKQSGAFSLVELLVVIAIIGLLLGLGANGLASAQRAMAITQAAESVSATLREAAQTAVSLNRTTHVRFYKIGSKDSTDSTKKIRALQIFLITPAGDPIERSKVVWLPSAAVVADSPDSPLFGGLAGVVGPMTAEGTVAGQSGVEYFQIDFYSDGRSSLPGSTWQDAWIKIQPDSGGAQNFATIAIEPATSKVRVFRP
jgi:uncharacterized protein (TIGR02596 family)